MQSESVYCASKGELSLKKVWRALLEHAVQNAPLTVTIKSQDKAKAMVVVRMELTQSTGLEKKLCWQRAIVSIEPDPGSSLRVQTLYPQALIATTKPGTLLSFGATGFKLCLEKDENGIRLRLLRRTLKVERILVCSLD